MDMPQVDDAGYTTPKVRSEVKPQNGGLTEGAVYVHSSKTDIRTRFSDMGFIPPSTTRPGQTEEAELKALRAFAKGVIENGVSTGGRFCVPDSVFYSLLESVDGISLSEEFPTAEKHEPTGPEAPSL